MASGEPSGIVKKTIANMYSKNRYAALNDSGSSGSSEDGGGGAPLYSPVVETAGGSSSGSDSSPETGETHESSPVSQESKTVPDQSGQHVNPSQSSDPADPASPVVAPANTNVTTPPTQLSSVCEDDDSTPRPTYRANEKQNEWHYSTANVQAPQHGNLYGHNNNNNNNNNNGGNTGGPASTGMVMPGGAYPTMCQMPQYYHGQDLAAQTNNMPGATPMYPQYAANAVYQHQSMPIPQQDPFPFPYPGSYQSPVTQGQAFSGTITSPTATSTKSGIKSTPKNQGTHGRQVGTPYPYNRTEPRNFAPRPLAGSFPPPPQFGLQGITSPGTGTREVSDRADDPFFAPAASIERSAVVVSSRSRLLSSVPESDEAALVPVSSYAVAPEIRALRSPELNKLTAPPTFLPTVEVALNPANFPFIESCTQSEPVSYGVIKIKNIPFATKRSEIIAFLGRNSKILNDNCEPVHIIMERVTSKTLDAYVEFLTLQDAMKAVERHNHTVNRGRLARLGDRPVDVELSSQSQLMGDLFPLAAGVMWNGSVPVIQDPVNGQPWKTFKGFVTEEEMTMLVKHVEIPHRSPFSKDCPQRPYECMISTIKKLPWHMSNHITIRQRYAVYSATFKLLQLLRSAMQRHQTPTQEATINQQLLKRLFQAAMLCPGFSVTQKDNIAYVMDLPDIQQRGFNQPRFPDLWSHEHAVCARPGCPLDVLEWYIAIIREETARYVNRQPINQRTAIEAQHRTVFSHYFGYLWYEIGYPSGPTFDNMTLHEAATIELSAMERIFHRAFPRE